MFSAPWLIQPEEIVHFIASQERTILELVAPFDMSLAAITKHIKVLERAGILERSVKGRTHLSS